MLERPRVPVSLGVCLETVEVSLLHAPNLAAFGNVVSPSNERARTLILKHRCAGSVMSAVQHREVLSVEGYSFS